MRFRRRPWRDALPALAIAAVCGPAAAADNDDGYAAYRLSMVREIQRSVDRTRDRTGMEKLDRRVMNVMRTIPRHRFVPKQLAPFAYLNRPLPVGHGQKVSQPYIVALMTDLARIEPDGTVLIVGMGGGYHAAIAARLARDVRCIEMFEPVAAAAMRRLVGMDYVNVQARVGDPYFGWPGARETFDAIIVRQSMSYVPRALINQLKPGGRIVMPLGTLEAGQFLTVIEKRPDGTTKDMPVLPVLFTKMPGGPRI